nr:hypothetical protein [Tanacetum cinerariifolium]
MIYDLTYIMNFSKSRSTFHKSHSPIRKSYYNATTLSKRNSNERVNIAGSEAVSVVKGNEVTTVKTSAGCVWRPRVNDIDQPSKDNRWICHPLQALKSKGIVDCGCSRHMTGNKAHLTDYQEINDGGFVAFGLSREAVNTVCYVLNRALVTKTHNMTPYELLNGRTPRLDFMRPFGCPVTILNTLDPLGKFEGKADEGFLVGYSVTIYAGNQTDKNAGPQDTNGNAGTLDNVDARKEVSDQHYIVLPLWSTISSTFKSSDDKAIDDKPTDDTGSKTIKEPVNKEDQAYRYEISRLMSQEKEASDAVYVDDIIFISIKKSLYNEFEALMRKRFQMSSIGELTFFLGLHVKLSEEGIFISQDKGTINKTLFIKKEKDDIMLVQVYVDDIIFGSTKKSLCDECEALMHKRFQMSSIGKLTFFLGLQVKQTSTPIETQKPLVKDEEAVDVDVQLDRSMIESLMYLMSSRPDIMFAVYACYRDSPFNLEAYSDSDYAGADLDRKSIIGGCQFLGRKLILWQCKKQTIVATSTTEAEDKSDILLVQVYVDHIIFGSTKKEMCTEFEKMMHNKFQMSSMGELTFFLGLQVKQKEDGIFISRDKYVTKILKKFDFLSVKTVSTLIETQNPLVKDKEAAEVTPKLTDLHAVKRIFRYLKGQCKLGLWYPRDSPFDLEAYLDSDYARANLD